MSGSLGSEGGGEKISHEFAPRRPLPLWITCVGSIAPVALLLIWSGALSGSLQTRLDHQVPVWITFPVALFILVGTFLLIGRGIRTKPGQRIMVGLLACLLVPFAATDFGGLYSYPVHRLTKGKDPAASLLLIAGLGLTVFGFGWATGTQLVHSLTVFTVSSAGFLLIRAVSGRAPGGLVGYGMLHFAALLGAMCVAAEEDSARKLEVIEASSPPQSR